jgi:hypothetical protein
VIGAAALLTYAIYGATLHYGLDYDDYHFLRPHARADVLDAFRGSWDRSGVMVPFYRPLTVAFSALRFELFGLNAIAHHALSLVLFTAAALLIARFVHRSTSRSSAAILTLLFFVCHPAMPYSLAAWITNQMHLLQILAVLLAITWWDAVRARRLVWWLPILGLAIVSFLIKEDGIMLLPLVIALHQARRWVIERDLRRVPLGFVVLSALTMAALVAARALALGELGGYGKPTAGAAWRNVWSTLYGMYRLVPADREWQPIASAFVTALPLVALGAWRWTSSAARYCIAAGAMIALIFSLPLVFGTKPEQVYMIAAGLALLLAGASVSILDLSARLPSPMKAGLIASTIIAGGLASLAIVTRSITRDFEPFGPMVLAHDEIVATWGHVAPEIRDYVLRKREPGARRRMSANPLAELTVVTFNVQGRETSVTGLRYMWMSGNEVEINVVARANEITIPLRHAIEAFREPARARVQVDGRAVDELLLETPEWRPRTIPLRAKAVPWLSGMHRLRIAIDHAWCPAEVIEGSTDGRILGLQIGMATVK